MKRVLLLILCPVLTSGQSMKPIWQLKWNMSTRQVYQHLKSNRNIIPESIKGDTSTIAIFDYRDQYLDGYKAFATELFFFSNSLTRCEIYFPNYWRKPESVLLLFDSIKTSIERKYFSPQFCSEIEDSKKKKYQLELLKSEDLDCYCNWLFPTDIATQKTGIISLKIEKEGIIVLIYESNFIQPRPTTDF